MTAHHSLRSQLPHRPPALYVEGVVSRSPEQLVCAGRLPAHLANPEVHAGSTTCLLALEMAAQATALWQEPQPGQDPPSTALLVSIRHAELSPEIPCDQPLLVTLLSLGGAGGLRKFHCAIAKKEEPEKVLASAELATFTRQ